MIPGRISGKQNETPEQCLAREVRAIEGQRRRNAEGQRDRHRRKSNQQAVQDGSPDGLVGKEDAIPVQSQVARRKSADA